jgi:hypothetical protein
MDSRFLWLVGSCSCTSPADSRFLTNSRAYNLQSLFLSSSSVWPQQLP